MVQLVLVRAPHLYSGYFWVPLRKSFLNNTTLC